MTWTGSNIAFPFLLRKSLLCGHVNSFTVNNVTVAGLLVNYPFLIVDETFDNQRYVWNGKNPAWNGHCSNSNRASLFSFLKHSFGRIFSLVRHCTMCCLVSMFSSQPNKLRHILKFVFWYTILHIFVPACSITRSIYFFIFVNSTL